MAVVYAFLADGLEEVECLATADVLIRAGVKVKLVSITGKKEVKGAHGFGIHADTLLHEIDPMKADLLFLPGGMPGTKNLMACKPLCDALVQADAAGKRLAAICAAPSILGQLGLLKDKKATCYPGFEDALTGAKLTGAGVVTDGNITTARGLGYALDLGIELASLLVDRPVALQVKDSIQYDQGKFQLKNTQKIHQKWHKTHLKPLINPQKVNAKLYFPLVFSTQICYNAILKCNAR